MIIRTAICDDNRVQAEYIRGLIDEWASDRSAVHAASIFNSAEELLFEYEENKNFDILFLDIQMNGMNGIKLAENIRRADKNVQIVFISGYSDYIGMGYDVFALHFLLKPVDKSQFCSVLDKAAAQLEKSRKYIILPCGDSTVKTALDDIMYARSISHYIKVYTTAGEYIIHMTLSDLEKLLGADFVRCHRSYIVAAAYIRSIKRNTLTLDDGSIIPVSLRRRDEVAGAFLRYYRK